MAIRITNAETERLIHEMAELHQMTPTQAVHAAVSQWLSPLELTTHEGKVIERIVQRRVWIAFAEGANDQWSRISSNVLGPICYLILFLVIALVFSSSRIAFLLIVIILSIISSYLYGRSLSRESEERSRGCTLMDKEIVNMKAKIPDELEFLIYGPHANTPSDDDENEKNPQQ